MLRGMFRGCATRVPFLNLSPPKKHKPTWIYPEARALDALPHEGLETKMKTSQVFEPEIECCDPLLAYDPA